MEIELLWPLIQEMVQTPDISAEDWAFLRQNADTLGCSEAILRALVETRLVQGHPDVSKRIEALGQLVGTLKEEASRHMPFLLEVAQYLGVPVDLVQVLVQVPRVPALRYMVRLLRAVEGLSEPAALFPWLATQAEALKLPSEALSPLLSLLAAPQQKSLTIALQSYWELLRLLDKQGLPAVEVAYLIDLAREARLTDPVSQGLQEYLRMRQKGTTPIEALAYLVRSFIQKGALSEEEGPFLEQLAQEEGLPTEVLSALIEAERALRKAAPGSFGAEYLVPLIQALLRANRLDEGAKRLLLQRGQEVHLTAAHIEALIELETQIVAGKARFPQSLQPLIRVLVEGGRISDDRLVFLIKKAQEMGGTDKVVRSLVQIEITAQKKTLQERAFVPPPPPPPPPTPPPAPSPVESPTSSPAPPSMAAPSTPPPPPSTFSSASTSSSGVSIPLKTPSFPSGGHFPPVAVDFHSLKLFSLRTEKDIVRKAEIFAHEGKVNWYAFLEYGEREYLLVSKGRPEHRFEEVLTWVVSPTGEVIALKHRLQGSYRVYLNGEEGRPLEEVASLILSPNHRHLAYIGRKGEDLFVFLNNIGMGPFSQVTNLTFRPNTENDLFFIVQVEKNRWVISDHLKNTYSEPSPYLDQLTFSPDGQRMVYVTLKNRKLHLREGDKWGDPFDLVSDVQFTGDSHHLIYLVQKGPQIGITWDHETLALGEGISGVTLSPDSRFVAYLVREKDQQFVGVQKKRLGPYERAERPFITRTKPAVIYPVVLQGRHHIFVNGAPEAGPFEAILRFSGQGDSYAAIVRKGSEGQAVLWDGKIGKLYSAVEHLTWAPSGQHLAYVARKKGVWAGVVWNDTESDQYDFVQHLTFSPDGKALLFFARRRDGWYAVLNDQPIPDTLCKELLSPPVWDAKNRAFCYLYRQGKDIYEGRLNVR